RGPGVGGLPEKPDDAGLRVDDVDPLLGILRRAGAQRGAGRHSHGAAAGTAPARLETWQRPAEMARLPGLGLLGVCLFRRVARAVLPAAERLAGHVRLGLAPF